MLTAVLSGFLLALGAPWLTPLLGRHSGRWFALLPLALTVYFASHIPSVMGGASVLQAHAWVPGLGVQLSFLLDGLSLLFALLISGIGVLVFVYAGRYLETHPHLGRFWAYLLVFMASMLGLVLADNLIALFVFWELTSISSYLLIGVDHERERARKAALQALLVTAGGGLALLAGFVLLALAGGSFELSELLGRGDAVRAHALYTPVLLLVLAGAFTKSAQVPFHFWLPSAMEAPTPVSAYLHAATMVKAGVYLLARMHPVLGGTDSWTLLVATFGAVTMATGMVLALRQTDLKLILAYTTVAALGTLTMLLGLGTEPAIKAAMVFLVVHSLYKGALFLVAGALDHATGTREVTQLGGLWPALPVTAAAGGLAALSMAGLPPLFGFIGKELIYEAAMGAEAWMLFFLAASMLAGVLLVAVAGLVGLQPFIGPTLPTPHTPHEPPPELWLGPAVLAVLGLLFGLLPFLVGRTLLAPAVAAVHGAPAPFELYLWHGFNVTLLLSLLTVAAGAGLYLSRERARTVLSGADPLLARGPAYWYERSLDALNWIAQAQTSLLQNGYLRYYLLTLIGTTVGLAAYTLAARGGLDFALRPFGRLQFYEVVVAVLLLVAAFVAVRSASRLGAVAALGVAGYSVALVYVLFGAPDLAITQILVETLTVLLFVLVFYRLPRFARLSPLYSRVRDALVAGSMGVLMTVLVLAAVDARLFAHISDYFVDQSVPAAHGRNIVNVILVDFRSLDTLGEIVVLVLAAIGVYALMKLYPGRERQ
jgi:multicomponent Na+:H+ antiporter subunit A